MIDKQKKEDGEAVVSTALFDNESVVIHDRLPLDKVPRMTEKEYFTRGCTALLDAVGGAIHHIGNIHKCSRKEDVPEKTLFIITTDGYENASKRYDYETVRKMIERQKEKYGWEFLFLGANIDAAADVIPAPIPILPRFQANLRLKLIEEYSSYFRKSVVVVCVAKRK